MRPAFHSEKGFLVALLPLVYRAPKVNPSVGGLYQAATLIDVPAPSRLGSGVRIYPSNFSTAFGTWDADPCKDPGGKTKSGDRAAPEDFDPLVVWGYDECDPTESIEDIRANALQNMRLQEQNLVESKFAVHLSAHLTADPQTGDLVSSVGYLDEQIAETGAVGFVHASVRFMAYAAEKNLIVRGSGSPVLRTPGGNVWVFGGGYGDALGFHLVATGQPTVWRDEITTNDAMSPHENLHVAVAERTIVAGHEGFIGGVKVVIASPPATGRLFIPGDAVPGDVVPG